MRRGRWIALILAAVVAAGTAAAPAAAAPDPDRKIVVYGQEMQALAAFGRVKCKVSSRQGGRKFIAKGKDGGWELEIHANDFTGYHEYPIEYGIRRTNFTIKPPGDNGFFANFFFPGDQPPPYGGALTFPDGRKRVGLGFIDAFSSRGDSDVVVVGKAKCV